MDRRLRFTALAVACVIALTAGATAYAYVTSDLTNWNLTESTTTWPTQYHVAQNTNGQVSYRWLDTPAKVTVISTNTCSDLWQYGGDSIGINDTSYHTMHYGSAGQCFYLRGRTSVGSGSMVNHDGRVQR